MGETFARPAAFTAVALLEHVKNFSPWGGGVGSSFRNTWRQLRGFDVTQKEFTHRVGIAHSQFGVVVERAVDFSDVGDVALPHFTGACPLAFSGLLLADLGLGMGAPRTAAETAHNASEVVAVGVDCVRVCGGQPCSSSSLRMVCVKSSKSAIWVMCIIVTKKA